MTGELSPEDRALIERTRKTNKTLSMFVFALQERSRLPSKSQLAIADLLVALADTIRERAAEQAATKSGEAIDGDSSWPLTLEPSKETGPVP
jgi:hypothetical protein